MEQQRSERSLGELFGDLTREIVALLRAELNLAKVETTQKVTQTGKDVGFLAVGGLIAYAGLLALLAALIIGLATLGLPWWLSALLVGIVVAGIGYFLVQKGLGDIRKRNFAPQETINTIKEDVEWTKKQMT